MLRVVFSFLVFWEEREGQGGNNLGREGGGRRCLSTRRDKDLESGKGFKREKQPQRREREGRTTREGKEKKGNLCLCWKSFLPKTTTENGFVCLHPSSSVVPGLPWVLVPSPLIWTLSFVPDFALLSLKWSILNTYEASASIFVSEIRSCEWTEFCHMGREGAGIEVPCRPSILPEHSAPTLNIRERSWFVRWRSHVEHNPLLLPLFRT